MEKVVIIGANHAGTACINTILDNSKNKEVIVFDSNSNISFLGCGMALWIGKQIDGSDGLFYANSKMLGEKGAKIMMECEVYQVDFKAKTVYARTKDNKEISQVYDKLVLATGSIAIAPRIEIACPEKVHRVKFFQDAQAVIDRVKNEKDLKDVTVIGAGYIGVELAESFKRLGKNVKMVDLASTCLANYYDHEFSSLMYDNLKENGIDCMFSQKLERIDKKGNRAVVVTNEEKFESDMVIMAIGFRPNSALAENDVDLFVNKAYKVNKRQQTSLKDVYAIGDCATVYDNAIEDVNYIALASNALRSGLIAGLNIAGKDVEGPGVQGSNGISIFGLNLFSTGMNESRAKKMGYDVDTVSFEDEQKLAFMKDDRKVKVKIVFDKKSRRVLGAQIASKTDVSSLIHLFSLAIQEKVSIERLRLLDLFFLPHFNKPYNYVNLAALKTL